MWERRSLLSGLAFGLLLVLLPVAVASAADFYVDDSYVITNAAGIGAVANTGDGLRIEGAANNTIGGTTASRSTLGPATLFLATRSFPMPSLASRSAAA